MTLIFKRSERMGKEFLLETTAHYNGGGEIGLTQIWCDGDYTMSEHSIVIMAEELKDILTQVEKSDTIK
jgi:hypothetical protein